MSGESGGANGPLTREELDAGVARLAPWFQLIDLGQGVLTKTQSVAGEEADHPRGEWELVRQYLPKDLSGKTLLDVGCNAGFFSFEAKRLGASRVMGIDAQRHHVRQATFVRRALSLDAEFRRLSVYDLDPRSLGQFDVTLALGLVYHLKHLVLALENLFRMTKELLIVESAIYPTPESKGLLGQSAREGQPDPARGLPVHLLAYVENPTEAKEAVYNWFLPTTGSLVALLRNVGFKRVEFDQYKLDRAIFICRKERAHADSRRSLENLRAALVLEEGPSRCRAGAEIVYRFRVENAGAARWLAKGEGAACKGAVRLGAHLLRADGEEVVWDYGRGYLSSDLETGESATVEIVLRGPVAPGSYRIEFDMVSEHLAWFEDLGSKIVSRDLEVGET
ncbi:MAG: tRNA (mo5U34)-methyltransferase [Acidobacteriota bacterium]|nr:tRNA (mo5U34)-methyltransferase [Acidobacteriota bacterium]